MILVTLAACTPVPPPTATLPLPTTIPPTATATPTSTPLPTPTLTVSDLCGRLGAAWGNDWQTVIAVLVEVRSRADRCDGKDPGEMLYPAYFNYAVWLEGRGRREEAVTAYRHALEARPDGREAALALQKVGAFTPAPLTTCDPAQVTEALLAIPTYVPVKTAPFIQIRDGHFVTFVTGDNLSNNLFRVRGVNYYPSRAPWRRFLTEADADAIRHELDLIRDLGLNTIRIFVRYESLFSCPGSGVVPIPENIARLDLVIREAAVRDLHLIVTLNDLPDLVIRPLYTFPSVAGMYTTFLVSRYRHEAAILAWDLRNEGDIDYTREGQSSGAVLRWLAKTAADVRALDANHLITAGWLSNPLPTVNAVDFVSFHHWNTTALLTERLKTFRAQTDKPFLVEEVGYSTYGGQEARQLASFSSVLPAAETLDTLGWLVWTAFDFPLDVTCIPPACPSKDNGEHHFGLWRTDYTPKPAALWLRDYLASVRAIEAKQESNVFGKYELSQKYH